jgi:hypothetical protein
MPSKIGDDVVLSFSPGAVRNPCSLNDGSFIGRRSLIGGSQNGNDRTEKVSNDAFSWGNPNN